MTWRPTSRPDLVADPFKTPIKGYKFTAQDGDVNATPARGNDVNSNITTNGGCFEITVTSDMFYKVGHNAGDNQVSGTCTTTDFTGYIKSDGADRVRGTFPKGDNGVPNTRISFCLPTAGAGTGDAYVTVFNQET